jgi:hypothetical protein
MTYNRTQKSLSELQAIIKEKVTGKIVACHTEEGHFYNFVGTDITVASVTTINGWIAMHHLAYWAAGCAIDFLEKADRISKLKGPERESIILGAKKAHTDIRDDAGNVGTQAHNAIEKYLKEWIATGIRPNDIRLFFPYDQGDTPFGFYLKDLDVTITMTDPRAIASARAAESVMIKENIIPVATEILVGHPKFSAGTLDFLCLWRGKLAIWDWKTSNQINKNGYPLQVGAYKGFFEYMTRLKIHGLVIMKLSKDSASFEAYEIPNLNLAYSSFKLFCKFYMQWLRLDDDLKINKIKTVIKI